MTVLRPPDSVLAIAGRLEAAGFETWCVGGAVRDALLGGAPLDWDLATSARPVDVQALFGRRHTVPVGIDFGTVAVLDAERIAHEVTTFRRDVHTDGRHAVVEFGVSLDDDLARRDFTINAIAWRPATGELRDPYGGRADLAERLVRAVGDPDARMREDRLRALRAIRFAARFEFAIHADTLAAIARAAPDLGRLSAERVQQELVKTMAQVARPAGAFRLWRSTGALVTLLPPLAGVSDVSLATLDCLPRASGSAARRAERTATRVAALVVDLTPGAVRALLRQLRFSRHDITWATSLAERWHLLGEPLGEAVRAGVPSDAAIRRWLAMLGRSHAGAFLRLGLARWTAVREAGGAAPAAAAVRALHRRMYASRHEGALALADLAITGDDLRRAGIPPGPLYATILSALLEQVLDDPARNTPVTLLAEVPRIVAARTRRAETGVHPIIEP